ncbi:MAG: MFS transporter [Pseudomonadota bacterium]
MAAETNSGADAKPQSQATIVAASAIGTVFEWYDFFIFGTLASIISKHFFSGLPEAVGFLVALLLFGVGFGMRPVGALVFGPIGDVLGRKRAFLVTVTLMGAATFLIGLLPTSEQVGGLAPILLLVLRCIQGFALGGEYGGAAIYVAEHAPQNRRGANTSWIQTSASIGLVSALLVILATRTILGEAAFSAWGWRVPFLLSAGLLIVSVWIRMQLEESPTFKKMKEEGKQSKAPLAESFLKWENLKLVLLSLFAVVIAQGVVWYTAHFYLQFYLERIVKLPGPTVNWLMICVVTCSAPLYLFFAWLSDRTGRKPIMLGGILVAAIAFFPGFQVMTRAANPLLWDAMQRAPVVVSADPAHCSIQFDPIGKTVYNSSCDIAKAALSNSGVSYTSMDAPGQLASVRIGEAVVHSVSGKGMDAAQLAGARKKFETELRAALDGAGYPASADPAKANMPVVFAIMLLFAAAATALYGPQAAALVELFPARIRYTALSLPYHIGTGWFGGFLPAIAFALVVGTGNIFNGLWYPLIGATISAIVMFFFLPETKGRDISA